jgi:hypothetical protein
MEIDWQKIHPHQLEELCWHILFENGFQNLEWIGGSGDRGRDILATKTEYPLTGFELQKKWIIQCKRYSRSPSPADLREDIAWAEAHRPDYFLIILTCTMTPGTYDWLNQIQPIETFKILVLDKPMLESQILRNFEVLKAHLPEDIRHQIEKLVPKKAVLPSEEKTIFKHMDLLREKAIDPWVKALRGIGEDRSFIAGDLSIESSSMGRVAIDRKIYEALPDDPKFDLSKAFLSHLKSGYPEQFENWSFLKREFQNYWREVEALFNKLANGITAKIKEKTDFEVYDLRGAPPNRFFVPNHLTYIVYTDLSSTVLSGKGHFEEWWKVNKDDQKEGVYYLSCGAFARLANGDKEKVEAILDIVQNIEEDKDSLEWMRLHLLKKKELDDNLSNFIEFLDDLSKRIENGKSINGKCQYCPES